MAAFKSWILVAFAVVVAAIAVSSTPVFEDALKRANSNDLIIGQREYNDKLMYQENISKKASYIGKKVIHEQTFNVTKNFVITQVLALDQITDGTGAFVVVTGGGPGNDSIKLRFKSQRFHGIYFTIQVFAKPRY